MINFKKILKVSLLLSAVFSMSLDWHKPMDIKQKMNLLVKEHQSSMPEKEFYKLGEYEITEEVIANPELFLKKNTTDFTYMGGRTFRFYVYAEGVDVRVLLKQSIERYHERTEEKILLDVVKSGADKSIAYYDYTFEEDNDFLLTFTPENNHDGYAIMMFYTISELTE